MIEVRTFNVEYRVEGRRLHGICRWVANSLQIEMISPFRGLVSHCHFDYKKMISDKGIVIKKYSSFKKENLMTLYDTSLSLWKEGLCLVFPDAVSGKICRMIAYNDKKSAAEIMQIIFHEYAHMLFRHTQQSAHGEAEANCFAIIATFILLLEKQFHIGRIIAQGGGQMLKQGLLNQIKSMEDKK